MVTFRLSNYHPCFICTYFDPSAFNQFGDSVVYYQSQNFAAKVVLGRRKFDSATEALRDLHWLPIVQRCKFKLLVLMYKSLNNLAPKYLTDLLVIHEPVRRTRSTANSDIHVVIPRTTRSTFAARSFAVSGPKYWNKLPTDIKACNSLLAFRKKLKTYLFNEYFNA